MTHTRPKHERAFVVQFLAEAPAEFAGSVEHVASGRCERFRSAAELTTHLLKLLELATATDPPPTG